MRLGLNAINLLNEDVTAKGTLNFLQLATRISTVWRYFIEVGPDQS